MMADKTPANLGTGAARAALGQGLMMGWGDEAEAWLRERMGQGSYADNLNKVRGEYAQFSEENPILSGASEFAGAAAPMLATAMIPGAQAAAPAAASTGLRALAKLSALGAAQGAVSGAGSATEGSRLGGATTGAVIGGVGGATVPLVMRGGGAGAQWLRDRLVPSEGNAANRATRVLAEAVSKARLNPRDLETKMAQDRAMNVPSMLLNVSPATAGTARGVVKRAGAGAQELAEKLAEQKSGTRERVYTQVNKALQPGDYFDDLAALREGMKTKAAPFYEKAYAYGEVADPEVLKFMKLPQFQQGLKEAEKLLAAEGRQVDLSKPTVEVLDQVKRGLDALIEKETDALTGKTTSLGRVYTAKKNDFLKALDTAVPDYGQARAVYKGDAELVDAMRKGYTEFNKTPHEQVVKMVQAMSPAEKEAYRTGAVRQLYGEVMGPAAERNVAKNLMGPERLAKLQPLFDSPAKFDLFKSALERENQLFQHAGRILGGSDTVENAYLTRQIDAQQPFGEFVGNMVTGGFKSALSNAALKLAGQTSMSDKTAEKLSKMLMAKDPNEVAAVVKLLESHAASIAPKAYRAGAMESGAVGGTVGSFWPSPVAPAQEQDAKSTSIEATTSELNAEPAAEHDIAADIAKELELESEQAGRN